MPFGSNIIGREGIRNGTLFFMQKKNPLNDQETVGSKKKNKIKRNTMQMPQFIYQAIFVNLSDIIFILHTFCLFQKFMRFDFFLKLC